MKLTLIKPNIGRMEHSLYVDEGRMEPLQLGVLAGLTPPDIDVELYDDRMESIPYDRPTDLVAITVETYTARRAYEISAEYRKRGVPVVMGGMQATLIPEEVAEHADAVVEVTGLRNPCAQLDGLRPGLMAATLEEGPDGSIVRKAGVMAVVVAGGEVRPGDPVRVSLPEGPHRPLEPV